jgi:hypothetical protein
LLAACSPVTVLLQDLLNNLPTTLSSWVSSLQYRQPECAHKMILTFTFPLHQFTQCSAEHWQIMIKTAAGCCCHLEPRVCWLPVGGFTVTHLTAACWSFHIFQLHAMPCMLVHTVKSISILICYGTLIHTLHTARCYTQHTLHTAHCYCILRYEEHLNALCLMPLMQHCSGTSSASA